MTTTQINGLGLPMVSGNKPNGATKETSDGSFASMMTASISGQAEKVSASSGDGVKDAVKPAETTQETAVEKEKPTNKAEQPEKNPQEVKQPKEAKTEQPKEVPEEPKLTEEQLEEAVTVLKKIQELVQDILNLDTEELNQLMEQLGITMVDLLNPQVLQQLVVQTAGGTDFSVLLMDESAGMNLQQLLAGVQEILQEAGMQPEELLMVAQSEEFAQLLEQQTNPDVIASEVTAETEAETALVQDTAETDNTEGAEASKEGIQVEVVREETSTGEQTSSEDTMRQDPQVAAGQVEQFMNRVAQAAEASFAEALSPAEQIRQIADQILEKIRVTIQPAQTSMEITLNPESLGKVNLNVVSKEGVMTAQFTAQTEAARLAIESQLSVLRENLQNQGLKVEAIEVTVSNFEFQQGDLNNTDTSGQQQENGGRAARRNLTLEEALSFDEVTEEESLALDMMERSGNQVDFIA
ncbi:MAG: flagellar hook-length control protein FliK [Lachnospiraceae bacterium]|nr:flagellar hook-length control protein FliK [Lachnospiraceae bacterium]